MPETFVCVHGISKISMESHSSETKSCQNTDQFIRSESSLEPSLYFHPSRHIEPTSLFSRIKTLNVSQHSKSCTIAPKIFQNKNLFPILSTQFRTSLNERLIFSSIVFNMTSENETFLFLTKEEKNLTRKFFLRFTKNS